MKHSVFQRSLAWLIAAILLLGTLPYFSPMQASASESTPFEKIVIFNGGSAGNAHADETLRGDDVVHEACDTGFGGKVLHLGEHRLPRGDVVRSGNGRKAASRNEHCHQNLFHVL